MVGWLVYFGFHQANVQGVGGLRPYLETLRENVLVDSFRWLAEFSSFRVGTVPSFSLAGPAGGRFQLLMAHLRSLPS